MMQEPFKTAIRTTVVLLTVSVAGAIIYSEWYASGSKELLAESPIFYFGVVDPGKVLNHSFRITNRGRATCTITNIITSCSCSVANTQKRTLEPGESTEIMVSLDTSGRYGRLEKTIILITDATPQRIPLTLAGDVRLLWTPPSKTVEFNYRQSDGKVRKSFSIELAGKARELALIPRKQSIPNYITVVLKRSSPDRYLASIELDAAKSPEQLDSIIYLDPQGMQGIAYPVMIRGCYRTPLFSMPSLVYLGIVEAGKTYPHVLSIGTRDSTVDLHNLQITVQSQCAFAEIRSSGMTIIDNTIRLPLTVKVKTDAPNSCQIVGDVSLNLGTDVRLVVPIKGYVRSLKQSASQRP